MNRKSLFLTILMIFPVLSGCKSEEEKFLKKYKNCVSAQEFKSQIAKKYEDSIYFSYVDYQYGFYQLYLKEDAEINIINKKEETSVTKIEKTTIKEKNYKSQEEKYEYDFDNKILNANAITKVKYKNNKGHKEKSTLKEYETFFEREKNDLTYLVEADHNTHLYQEVVSASNNNIEYKVCFLAERCGKEVNNVYGWDISKYEDNKNIDKEETSETSDYTEKKNEKIRFYADGNAFTYVVKRETKQIPKSQGTKNNIKIDHNVTRVTQIIIDDKYISYALYQYITKDTNYLDGDTKYINKMTIESIDKRSIEFKSFELETPKLKEYTKDTSESSPYN